MSSNFNTIAFVGRDESARAIVRLLVPSAVLKEFPDLDAALAATIAPGPTLLLFIDPSPEDLLRALKAVDEQDLPRWTVIARRPVAPIDNSSEALVIPASEWNETILRHGFSAAAVLHAALRDKARLRGDLRTLSRRYNHDLRTPLNCVSTASDALSEPGDKPDSPRSVFLRSITSSVDDVSRLLERVGFVLKATATPEPLASVAMGDAVWAATQRLNSRIMKSGAQLASPKDWPVVSGVAGWLDAIWWNLIGNALQHSGPQPQITLGWEKTENGFRFWVRDSGKGIAIEKRARLFYPFHQLNNLNAPRGFGLPITRRLVELQGGTCGYDPEPAPAGTFYFTLPATVSFHGSPP